MRYSDAINQIVPKAKRLGLTDPETGQVDLAEVELTVLSVVQRLADGWDLDAFTVINDGLFATTTGEDTYALPANFGRLITPREDDESGIYLWDGTALSTLTYKDPEDFVRARTTTNGVPSDFTIAGEDILLDPPPDSGGYTGRGVYIIKLDTIEPDGEVLLAHPMVLVDAVVAEMAILRGHAASSFLENKAERATMRMVNHQARVRQRFRPRTRTQSASF